MSFLHVEAGGEGGGREECRILRRLPRDQSPVNKQRGRVQPVRLSHGTISTCDQQHRRIVGIDPHAPSCTYHSADTRNIYVEYKVHQQVK